MLAVELQGSGDPSPLKCRMQHTRLLDEPIAEYYAVSYTWGDSSVQKAIVVDGVTVSVPAGADQALRYLADPGGSRKRQLQVAKLKLARLKERYSKHRNVFPVIWLWFDAMFINQSDLAERSQQVALMGGVYIQALPC